MAADHAQVGRADLGRGEPASEQREAQGEEEEGAEQGEGEGAVHHPGQADCLRWCHAVARSTPVGQEAARPEFRVWERGAGVQVQVPTVCLHRHAQLPHLPGLCEAGQCGKLRGQGGELV